MPSYLHTCRQFLLQVRSRYLVKVALPGYSPGAAATEGVALGQETRRALEWQRVDALLESLRRLQV